MKKFPIVVLFFMSLSIYAQWVQTNGPKTGFGTKLLVSYGSNIYAAAGNGAYISTDSGNSWSFSGKGLEYQSGINSIVSTGSKLLAGLSAIYASTDNGLSWFRSNEGIWDGRINALAANSIHIYAGSETYGLFVSSDNGVTWTKATNNGMKKDEWGRIPITALALKDNFIFAGTWYSDGLYVTIDNGSNWTLLNNGLTGKNITSILISDQNIFVGTDDQGIFLSQNNGASWKQLNTELPTFSTGQPPQIIAIGNSGSKIFVSLLCFEGRFIYSTSDNGTTWQKINDGIVNDPISPLAVSFTSSNNRFYVGVGTGIYELSPDGNSWIPILDRFTPLTSISNLITHDNNLFALGGKIYKSVDAGNTWELLASPKVNVSPSFIGLIDNNLIVNADGLYSTTDYGKIWTSLNEWPVRAYYSDGKIYSMKGYHTFNVSSDLGKTWNPISPNTPVHSDMATSVDAFGNNLFIGIEYKGLVFSTDNGTTWQKNPTGFPKDAYVMRIVKKGYQLFTATWNKGVFLSNDGGFNWYEANSGLESTLSIASINIINNKLFVIASQNNYNVNGKIFVSNDNGYSWKNVNEGFTNENVTCIEADKNYFFAGTGGNGVWKRPITEIITDVDQKEIPKMFSLSQNYPNPFNPSTTIKYSIPVVDAKFASNAHVTLKVYDVLGREVATLVDEVKAPGTYEVKFDTRHASMKFSMTSSVYFYHLQSGNYSETKKLILMK